MDYVITLQNAEARALLLPSFELPPRHEREGLRRGDFAKVIFVCHPPLSTGQSGERMWLEVITVLAPGAYRGKLANYPSGHPFTRYTFGQVIDFGAEHVINVQRTH